MHKFEFTIGNGILKHFTLTHSLETSAVFVQVMENKLPSRIVYAEIEIIDNNNVRINFEVPPSEKQYKVIIAG